MNEKKLFISIFFLVLSVFTIDAQDMIDPLRIIPKDPEKAAIDKLSDTEVNTALGIPDISIPLFTLQGCDISIPITISYNASGIKVNDISSTVGLGWVLQAGGSISRNILGNADECGGGVV